MGLFYWYLACYGHKDCIHRPYSRNDWPYGRNNCKPSCVNFVVFRPQNHRVRRAEQAQRTKNKFFGHLKRLFWTLGMLNCRSRFWPEISRHRVLSFASRWAPSSQWLDSKKFDLLVNGDGLVWWNKGAFFVPWGDWRDWSVQSQHLRHFQQVKKGVIVWLGKRQQFGG